MVPRIAQNAPDCGVESGFEAKNCAMRAPHGQPYEVRQVRLSSGGIMPILSDIAPSICPPADQILWFALFERFITTHRTRGYVHTNSLKSGNSSNSIQFGEVACLIMIRGNKDQCTQSRRCGWPEETPSPRDARPMHCLRSIGRSRTLRPFGQE